MQYLTSSHLRFAVSGSNGGIVFFFSLSLSSKSRVFVSSVATQMSCHLSRSIFIILASYLASASIDCSS